MKNSITIILALVLSTILSGNSLAIEDHKKAVSFDKTSHSFGLIMQGEKVSTTFKLKNNGDEPVSIVKASSSCGCTIPSFSKEAIKKGKEGKIELQFNSAGRKGAFSKSAVVKFSDGTQETIKITGEVLVKPKG